MLTRYVSAAAVFFALTSLSAAARAPPPAKEAHEVAIDQQVEVAQSMADHEAVAQGFEAEAGRFVKQAAEYARLAKHYRSPSTGLKKEDAADLASHCDRIAKDLRESAADARAMASLHRNVLHMLVK